MKNNKITPELVISAIAGICLYSMPILGVWWIWSDDKELVSKMFFSALILAIGGVVLYAIIIPINITNEDDDKTV